MASLSQLKGNRAVARVQSYSGEERHSPPKAAVVPAFQKRSIPSTRTLLKWTIKTKAADEYIAPAGAGGVHTKRGKAANLGRILKGGVGEKRGHRRVFMTKSQR